MSSLRVTCPKKWLKQGAHVNDQCGVLAPSDAPRPDPGNRMAMSLALFRAKLADGAGCGAALGAIAARLRSGLAGGPLCLWAAAGSFRTGPGRGTTWSCGCRVGTRPAKHFVSALCIASG